MTTASPTLRLHFVVFLFGFTGILGDLISLSAVPLVWVRMAMALLLLLGWAKFTGKKLSVPWRDAKWLLLAGCVIAAHWITFFHAIKISTVSVTLACLSAAAFFSSFLEPLFFRKRLVPYEMVLGGIAVVGLYLIFRFEGDYAAGIITALISAFLSALFGVINGLLVRKVNPETIVPWELGGGWLGITLFTFVVNPSWITALAISPTDWLWLFLLASACTAYAFIESVRILQHLSPYTVSLTINLEPVYGILLAFFLLGTKEHMSTEFYVGAAVILATVVADSALKRRAKRRLGAFKNL